MDGTYSRKETLSRRDSDRMDSMSECNIPIDTMKPLFSRNTELPVQMKNPNDRWSNIHEISASSTSSRSSKSQTTYRSMEQLSTDSNINELAYDESLVYQSDSNIHNLRPENRSISDIAEYNNTTKDNLIVPHRFVPALNKQTHISTNVANTSQMKHKISSPMHFKHISGDMTRDMTINAFDLTTNINDNVLKKYMIERNISEEDVRGMKKQEIIHKIVQSNFKWMPPQRPISTNKYNSIFDDTSYSERTEQSEWNDSSMMKSGRNQLSVSNQFNSLNAMTFPDPSDFPLPTDLIDRGSQRSWSSESGSHVPTPIDVLKESSLPLDSSQSPSPTAILIRSPEQSIANESIIVTHLSENTATVPPPPPPPTQSKKPFDFNETLNKKSSHDSSFTDQESVSTSRDDFLESIRKGVVLKKVPQRTRLPNGFFKANRVSANMDSNNHTIPLMPESRKTLVSPLIQQPSRENETNVRNSSKNVSHKPPMTVPPPPPPKFVEKPLHINENVSKINQKSSNDNSLHGQGDVSVSRNDFLESIRQGVVLKKVPQRSTTKYGKKKYVNPVDKHLTFPAHRPQVTTPVTSSRAGDLDESYA